MNKYLAETYNNNTEFFLAVAITVMLICTQTGCFVASDGIAQTNHQWNAWTGWQVPQCKQISGVSFLAFTQNEGHTIVASPEKLVSEFKSASLTSLTPLHAPNTFLANSVDPSGSFLMISQDAGCTWNAVKNVEAGEITADQGGGAYIWSNGMPDRTIKYPSSLIYYKDNQTKKLQSPFVETDTLLVDLSNSRHLRAAGKRPLDSKGNVIKLSVNSSISDNSNNREKYDTRAIADSFDGGKTWSITARCPMKDAAIRCEVAINPNNFDQMIYPDAFGEGSISFDGGKNWRKTNLKILSAVFSPVNSNIVWALGWEDVEIKLEQISNSNTNTIISNYNSAQNTTWNNSNIAWDKMTKSEWGIYLSRDGGRTFSLEIKDSNEHPLRFSILKSHPSDANILYYAESFFLTKYDLKSQVKSTHEVVQSREFLKIKEIIFSPANPSSVYLSFEVPVRTILN